LTEAINIAASLANVVIAIGTLVTVLIAVATLRAQITERRLDRVRNIRSWMEWVTVSESDGRPDLDESSPLGIIRNQSSDPIYNLRYRLFLGESGRQPNTSQTRILLPGSSVSAEHHRAFIYQEIERMHSSTTAKVGLELAFTDLSGRRWLREGNGYLRTLKPLRWYVPFRSIHMLDYGTSPLPWWAIGAIWEYRRDIVVTRDMVPAPPPFIAVDVRWERWRSARKESPVPYPWWNVRARYGDADRICSDRERAQLPIPFWAFKQRFVFARKWRRSLRRWNANVYR
jgi:hypothetical protein